MNRVAKKNDCLTDREKKRKNNGRHFDLDISYIRIVTRFKSGKKKKK